MMSDLKVDLGVMVYQVSWLVWQMQGRIWAEDERSSSVHAAMVEAALQLHAAAKSQHSDLEFFLQNSRPAHRKETSHF